MVKVKVETEKIIKECHILSLDVDSYKDIWDNMSFCESQELIRNALEEQIEGSWDSFNLVGKAQIK